MKEMLRYLRPYRWGLLLSTLLFTVATVCDLLLPTIMSSILNSGIYAADLHYIVGCCMQMLFVTLLGLTAMLAGSKISSHVVASYCGDLRREIFAAVNRMTFEEFGKLGTAALVTRATRDVETVSWIAAELAGTIITIPVLFVGGVVLTMRKDAALALILLAFMPVILCIVFSASKRIFPLFEKSDAYIDKQNDIMRERLRGIRVIRAFRAEEQEHEKIANATREMSKAIIQGNVSMGLVTPLVTFILNVAAILIVYLGTLRMESGSSLSGGDIFAIVQYISLATSGVIMGAFTIIMFPDAKASAARIGQVLHAEKLKDDAGSEELQLRGDILLENVSFAYENATENALQNVSLHIRQGEKIAVIGGTGAGKSTLVKLLMGFYAPTAGEIYLDGMAISKLSKNAVRKNISGVLQNTAIYSGTIRENIAMGKQNATDEEIWDALSVAQAKDFVESFEDGLHHEIKQSGKNLSGGQKQRICIARAVLKDASLYIFDDSFSALDFLTEARLRMALAQRIAGKTQIMITQRVTSAMHADRIYVLDNGQLVGVGDHEELMKSCLVYQEIYASQVGGTV